MVGHCFPRAEGTQEAMTTAAANEIFSEKPLPFAPYRPGRIDNPHDWLV
jgi:hypothetical protein